MKGIILAGKRDTLISVNKSNIKTINANLRQTNDLLPNVNVNVGGN